MRHVLLLLFRFPLSLNRRRIQTSSPVTRAFAPAQVGSVAMVALLYYLDHPHPFNSRTAVAPLAQQLESQEQ